MNTLKEITPLASKITDYFTKLKNAIDLISVDEILMFNAILADAYRDNKRIFIMGNGGSAATASHFVCDLNKGVSPNSDKKFQSLALTNNMPIISAYANDANFHDIFVGQLKNFLSAGDVVIAISGSGNSENLIKAIEYANEKNAITIGLTGYDGGKLKKIVNHSINANVNDMQISEDIHMILAHLTMQILNDFLKTRGNL